MKLAVMSCIHGNIEALNAVLSDIDAQKAEQIYCLGDLVGYGPDPNAVVEMIRSLDIPTCQGCWDEDIVDGLNACECSYPSQLAEQRGRVAHEWTNAAIHPEVREYLATLPMTLRKDNLCFVHGSPNSQHEYLLPSMDGFAALERLLSAEADVLFCGHTHVPYDRRLEDAALSVKVGAADSGETLQQIQVPVGVIASKDDPVIPWDTIQQDVMALLTDVTLTQLSGVGHLIPLEVPEQLANSIRADVLG